MPSYQIYLPHGHGSDPTQLARVGLEIPDMFDGAAAVDVAQGPDGNRGVIFHWHDPRPDYVEYNPTPGYHPEFQEWTPAKARGQGPEGRGQQFAEGRFWMGRESGRLVEPESILRKSYLDGTMLPLADGQEWLIAAAPMLPQKIGLDNYGRPVRAVDPRYQRYWDQVVGYYEIHLQARDNFEAIAKEAFTLEHAWPFAIQTLQFNYRLDANLIDWLGLLDEENIVRLVLRTFMGDQLRLADALKKKLASKSATTAGKPAASDSASSSPSPSDTATASPSPGAAAC